MSDKEVGNALVRLDEQATSRGEDAKELARHVLQRDQVRIRLLTGFTIFCWVLAVVGVIWLTCFYFMFIVPRLNAYADGRVHLENDWKDWVRAFDAGAEIVLGCITSLLMAGLSTVLLIFLSRRATLRQIQADLAEISHRLSAPRI